MDTSVQTQQAELNVKESTSILNKSTVRNKNYAVIDEIKKIQALKQDTFESTSDFYNRREQAITEFRNKVKFFSQNGSKEYSAGTAEMISYDADTERMKLTLNWNTDLKFIFSEIKNRQTVSLNIAKDEAKKLFEKQKTYYFHIDVAYVNTKLTVSGMLVYDKYKMYKTQNRPVDSSSSPKIEKANNKEMQKLEQEKAAMELELQRLKAQKNVPIQKISFQQNTDRTLGLSQNNNNRNRRNYLYVCYDEKFLTRGKAVYNGCIRKASACKHSRKYHFGKYPNDSKAHVAFIRCISSSPKFVDYQGL